MGELLPLLYVTDTWMWSSYLTASICIATNVTDRLHSTSSDRSLVEEEAMGELRGKPLPS